MKQLYFFICGCLWRDTRNYTNVVVQTSLMDCWCRVPLMWDVQLCISLAHMLPLTWFYASLLICKLSEEQQEMNVQTEMGGGSHWSNHSRQLPSISWRYASLHVCSNIGMCFAIQKQNKKPFFFFKKEAKILCIYILIRR